MLKRSGAKWRENCNSSSFQKPAKIAKKHQSHQENAVACSEEQITPTSHCCNPKLLSECSVKKSGNPSDDLSSLGNQSPVPVSLTREMVIEKRDQMICKGQYSFYQDPLMLVHAKGQYCYDEAGKQYLDAYSNVAHVGHCHTHVVQSAYNQMLKINSNTRYLHPGIVEYCQMLTDTLPGELKICFFVNSGSEANDLALRMARVYTQRKDIVALNNAYHGTTALCTGVSPSLSAGSTEPCIDFPTYSENVHFIDVPDVFKGKFRDKDAYLNYALQFKETLKSNKDKIAAFIVESIQGVGGQIVYPDGYLKEVFKSAKQEGIVCIADEVQVGFGRTGESFWGFQSQGVIPDIVTMGKPIGNGHPLACVVTTPDIARAFEKSKYFNTFGGNPVSVAIGKAVMEVIERENLQENAKRMGTKMLHELEKLKEKYVIIGDVRGLGLFIGVELVCDRQTLEPASKQAQQVWEITKDLGVLIGLGGPHKNVLRIKPPMCITSQDVDSIIHAIEKALSKIE